MRSLIAILRGIQPKEAVDMARMLVDVGFDKIEVPLNSPSPFESIANMIDAVGDEAMVGAGTVLKLEEVKRLGDIGAKLVVSPNCNPDIIKAAKDASMTCIPGVITPTECFTALDAGADGLKIFPASIIGPSGLKAIKVVLPKGTKLYAVSGVGPHNFEEWMEAGADGFGLYSILYQPGHTIEQVSNAAKPIIKAYDEACSKVCTE